MTSPHSVIERPPSPVIITQLLLESQIYLRLFLNFFSVHSLSFSLIQNDNLDAVIHHGFNHFPRTAPLPLPNNCNDLGLRGPTRGGWRDLKKTQRKVGNISENVSGRSFKNACNRRKEDTRVFQKSRIYGGIEGSQHFRFRNRTQNNSVKE